MNINIGMEIECIINSQIKNVMRGPYRNGVPVRGLLGFKAERDGSVFTKREFSAWSQPTELISKTYPTTTAFKTAMKRFEKFFSKNGTHELHEVLAFNESCGSHLHLSLENHNFARKSIFLVFHRARKFFLDKIKASNISSKQEIVDHYFRKGWRANGCSRNYAAPITKENFKRGRTMEFNFDSEREGKGLEWRSINMKGIKTWAEFRELINIICESAEYLAKTASCYKRRGWIFKYKAAERKQELKIVISPEGIRNEN